MGDSKRIVGLALVPVGGLIAQTAQAEPAAIRFDPQANVPSPIAPDFSERGITELGNTQVSIEGNPSELGGANRFSITGGTQVEQNLFHRFDRFNLDAGQIATFLTNPNTRAVFGQVSGGNASYLDGLLQVSGSSADLFVINPSGILFGPNARLDLGGAFTATTADWIGFGDAGQEQWLHTLTGQNYSGGQANAFGFSAVAPGSIVNQGVLAVPQGQSLRLLGGNVVNLGQLIAPGGEVSAIATPGPSVVRLQDASGLLRVSITPQDFSAIASSQAIAQSTHPTDARSRPELLTGQPQAAEASAMRVNADGSVSLISSQIDVSQAAGTGGQVNLVGKTVQLTDSVVEASGAMGGTIRVGGDAQGGAALPGSAVTRVDAKSVLRADGLVQAPEGLAPEGLAPEGGNVIIWSDGSTEVAGTLSARGGGLVETSGAQGLKIADTARVETAADGADGADVRAQAGTWLLDPLTLTVANSGGDITPGTVVANLQTTNVTLQADNQITITDAINASGNTAVSGQGNLTLDAPTVDLNARVTLQPGRTLTGSATTVNVGANGSVQNGLDAATTGGSVNLAAATYREGREIVIDRSVQLRGQGGSATTLSGDALGNGNIGAAASDNHRVLRINGGGGADGTTIAALSLRHGVANGNGGALTNGANNVVISATNFTDNRTTGATSDGGAIHNQGSLRLEGLVLSNNQAQRNGGAIDVVQGEVVLSNVVLNNNAALTGNGGAVDVDPSGRLTVSNITFEQNTAAGDGGAIDNDGVVQVTSAGFRDNVAQREGGAIFIGNGGNTTISQTGFSRNIGVERGGAISNRGDATTQLTVQSVNFSENQVTSNTVGLGDGGAIYLNGAGTTTVQNASFFDNRSSDGGGAIAARGDTVLLLNDVTLERNIALNSIGGAIDLAQNSRLTLNNSRISQNQAADQGGGLSLEEQAQATITNTTFNGNQAATDGGAIASSSNANALTISGVGIVGNSAGGDGGGIYNRGRLSLSNASVNQNTANRGAGIATIGANSSATLNFFAVNDNVAMGRGGGLFNQLGTVNLTDGSLNQNISANNGGGLLVNGGTIAVNRVELAGNQAGSFGGGGFFADTIASLQATNFLGNTTTISGGGLQLERTNTSIIDSQFGNNQAQFGGGLEAIDTGLVQVDNTSFYGNFATVEGGALKNENAVLMVLNRPIFTNNQSNGSGGAIANLSTLTLNQAYLGNNRALLDGGAVLNGGDLTVNQTTFQNNVADRYGAGIYNSGQLEVEGSTFQGGSAIAGGGIFSDNGQNQVANSLFEGNVATGGLTTGDGAGIYNYQSQFDIATSTFQNNQAEDFGGAIASLEGDLSIVGTTISGNSARIGGGLHQNLGSLAIADSIFLNNQSLLQGGGLDLFGVSNASIQRTLLQGNQAGDGGGGIALGGATNLTLDRVSLLQNQGFRGGGLDAQLGRNYQGTLNIIDSTIASNQSTSVNGGGMDVNPIVSSPVNISGSTINQNRSARDGGGIVLGQNAIFNVSNTTLSENQANGRGGGIANFGTLNLTHTTLADNQSDADSNGAEAGGGLFTDVVNVTRLNNTIVAHNQAANGVDVAGNFVDQGNNLIGIADGSTGFTNSTLVGTSAAPMNPLLAPLGNNGGLTQTRALLPGSPGIDAGNSSVLSDQRGIGRVNAPDIGAFESRAFVLTAQGGGGQTTEVTTAFGSPLAVAIASPFGEPVDGGQINFVAPTTGSSAVFSSNPLAIPITAGAAQISLSANGVEGTYAVSATGNGLSPVVFTLTNTLPPLIPPPSIPPPPTPPPTPPAPTPPAPVPPPTRLTPLPSLVQSRLPRSPQSFSPPEDSPERESPLSWVDGNSIEKIDQALSAEYSRYWGFENSEGSSLAQTRALLRQADTFHQARSAVIYALFVPRDQAEGLNAADFGSAQSARLALNRRLQNTAIRDDDQLLLVLVPSVGPPVQQLLEVTRQEVLQQAKLFRMAVSDPEDDISYRPLAQQMYQWLFAPVEPDVQRLQLDNVMYVVDPGLRTVPLAAMMNDDRFIVERYGLSIIPSVNLLQTSFGDPPPPPQTVAAGADQFMQQENLPAVSLELAAIADSQKSTQVLLNEAFTQTNLATVRAQSQAAMLHLATHAEFNAGDLPSSYLQFWDSQLTFDQIREMGWEDLELLILSACATAISSPEAELGFAGLAAATGVESSIGSLWNVSDVGTLALMAEFYGHWSQTPLRFDALRRSQLSLLQGDTQIANQSLLTARGQIKLPAEWNLPESADFRHPFYWSGFTLVGNPWW